MSEIAITKHISDIFESVFWGLMAQGSKKTLELKQFVLNSVTF